MTALQAMFFAFELANLCGIVTVALMMGQLSRIIRLHEGRADQEWMKILEKEETQKRRINLMLSLLVRWVHTWPDAAVRTQLEALLEADQLAEVERHGQ